MTSVTFATSFVESTENFLESSQKRISEIDENFKIRDYQYACIQKILEYYNNYQVVSENDDTCYDTSDTSDTRDTNTKYYKEFKGV